MKVLFVCSGNSVEGISPIVKGQGESLQKIGVDLHYYTIKGKGVFGYVKNIVPLAKHLRTHKYDIVHAHYSFSGFCATLAGAHNLIVSLMGSDVHQSPPLAILIRLFSRFCWKATIVKSPEMSQKLKLKQVSIFPNGVDFEKFKAVDKHIAQQLVSFDVNCKNVIFVSDPLRFEKNYTLAQQAVQLLNDDTVKLHAVYNIPHQAIVNYMYAADALILTSLWEGSPNVIKEALTCNCPLVTVEVGDVVEVIAGVDGCYLTTYNPADVAMKLRIALDFEGRTQGRNKVVELGLNAELVATKIQDLYKKCS